jgi:hypothetical protein
MGHTKENMRILAVLVANDSCGMGTQFREVNPHPIGSGIRDGAGQHDDSGQPSALAVGRAAALFLSRSEGWAGPNQPAKFEFEDLQ